MELRRAILLFAIVLGLAAVVTVLAGGSRDEPREDRSVVMPRSEAPTSTSSLEPTTGGANLLRFNAAGAPERRTATVGRQTTISVSSDEAGDVELRGLGQLAPVEPTVPARFDLLPDAPGRYRVTFVTAGGTTARTVGTLVVRPAAP